MRTLFVMDPLDRLHLEGDSTYALMAESTRRGWGIAWCTPSGLSTTPAGPRAHCQVVTAHLEGQPFRDEAPFSVEPLSDFDCIWLRKDPPFDMAYIFSTYLLDLALPTSLVFNDPRSIKCANEKMYALQWRHLCPPTLVTNRVDDIRAFAQEYDRIVLKPWDGNGGYGVVISGREDGNLAAMAELLTLAETGHCIAQRYVPEIKTTGDKRIILVDGEARGWFSRLPGPHDHRGNMHVGARVLPCELTDRDRQICEELAPRLKDEGLLFTGIDVIGDWLTEINVTSPTGIREIVALQGRDLAAELCERAVELHRERRG